MLATFFDAVKYGADAGLTELMHCVLRVVCGVGTFEGQVRQVTDADTCRMTPSVRVGNGQNYWDVGSPLRSLAAVITYADQGRLPRDLTARLTHDVSMCDTAAV